MASPLLKRLIVQASDALVDAVYQRILEERRSSGTKAPPLKTAGTWERIARRAVNEKVFSSAEAAQFLAEIHGGQRPPIMPVRERLKSRQSTRSTAPAGSPPRADDVVEPLSSSSE